ncbi:hypothetical protein GGI04_000074 [Coemansia thaxteri]|uniref:Phosducin domain-containing protein n=1 Tax=Coemansia thaxteri TaxID=2663907 RepID=A0A9W8BFF2_9FUNG|nr:hypothetical protein H4R26_001780 [Coemansia thaxteri]KAJ2009865.1 hypothetical protein GGI04_000074 [Coemansia thaxteri]KAJ2474487.1 hypothetical protein GGI02_000014 [Coemansia sp. RSA 2322]KAJ2486076.1 hypothetical protein EV174_001351 [Coemansia sp. RSA 2320]
MADIERQLLRQAASDEDDAERSRKVANGDAAPPAPSADDAVPAALHDGPQTGAKGVVADYRHARRERRQRQEQEAAAARAAYAAAVDMRSTYDSSRGQTLWTTDPSNIDSDDGDDDEFFAEYRRQRAAEMARAAERNVLRDVAPDEYVEIVEHYADSGASVAVILADSSPVSARFEALVREAAPAFPLAHFLRVDAADCGFADPDLVPILLVYRHAELAHNMVRVVDHFRDPASFGLDDVAALLGNVLRL